MTLDGNHLILTLLNLKGIGPSFIVKHQLKVQTAINKGQEVTTLLEACKKNVYENEAIDQAVDKAVKTIELANSQHIKMVNMFDDIYPQKLLSQNAKFPILFYIGTPNFNAPIIGIIGSRDATEIGSKVAERVGRYFAEKDFQIVNGIAVGIDVASSSSTIASKNTIGVVPGGLNYSSEKTLNKTYKAEAEKVLEKGGTLVSSYLPNHKQDRYSVVEYCKLQAALADALIIIQSQTGGGSRFTVGPFSQLTRPLGVVNISKFDKNNVELYTANDLIIQEGKQGLASYTDLKETKIKCDLVVIEDKNSYEQIISLVNKGVSQNTLL